MDSSLVDLTKRIVEKDKRVVEKDKRVVEKDRHSVEKDRHSVEKDKRRQIRKSRSDDYHTRHKSRSSPSKSHSRQRKHSTRSRRHRKAPPLDLTGSRSAPPYYPESYDDRLTWSSYAPSLHDKFVENIINKPPKYKRPHEDKISLLENLRRKIEVLRVTEPYLHRLNQSEFKRSYHDSKRPSSGDLRSGKKGRRSDQKSKRETLVSESESFRDSSSKFSSTASTRKTSGSKREVVHNAYTTEPSGERRDKHHQQQQRQRNDQNAGRRRSSTHRRSSTANYKRFDKRKDSRRNSHDVSDRGSDQEYDNDDEDGPERCRRNGPDGGCIDEDHPSGMSFSQFRDVLMRSSCSEGADSRKSGKQLCEAFCKEGGGCKIFSQLQ